MTTDAHPPTPPSSPRWSDDSVLARESLSTPEQWLTSSSLTEVEGMSGYSWDTDLLLRLSHADRIGQISPRRTLFIGELSELAGIADDGVFAPNTWGHALGRHLRDAVERRCTLWLGLVDEAGFHTLSTFLGPGLLHIAGSQDERSSLTPVALNPIDLITAWASNEQRAQFLRVVLKGVPTLRSSRRALAALAKAGVVTPQHSRMARLAVNPTFLAYVVVFIYSSMRALPVALVPGFTGKVGILWTIDVITAIPYTWGVLAMVAGRHLIKRIIGLVVTVVTFMAPYIYFWIHGRNAPPEVLAFVAAMILGAIALEVVRWWRDVFVRRWLDARI